MTYTTTRHFDFAKSTFSQFERNRSIQQSHTPYPTPTTPASYCSWTPTQYQQPTRQRQNSTTSSHDFALYPRTPSVHAVPLPARVTDQPTTWSYETAPAILPNTTQSFDWSMFQGQAYNSMGSIATPVQQQPQGIKRARSHQRTPSASTVGSTGPTSPFAYNSTFPQVAASDYGVDSPIANAWDLSSSSNIAKSAGLVGDSQYWAAESGYLPSQAAHMPAPHLAMKGFAIDHHNSEDMASADYQASSRQSSASSGRNSPATPRSAAEDSRGPKSSPSDNRQLNPSVQLVRTESAAFQDELYNPANFVSAAAANSSAARQTNNFLSPHRNLVNERLQTANIARSTSPTSAVSRERSPFRHGSPLAPIQAEWSAPQIGMGTAASVRQQQKAERVEKEYERHRPVLNREATKTISPKDAQLEYNDVEQAPLFQDSIPQGYKQHFGNADPNFQSYFSQDNAQYDMLPPGSQPSMPNFRATSGSVDGYAGGNLGTFGNFPTAAMQSQSQPQAAFQRAAYQPVSTTSAPSYPATATSDPAPHFPAHLTSMESSISDEQPISSQEADNSIPVPPITRPADTRAATGTYTCTYHGCTERFDSQQNLQRHKRDFHRSQAHSKTSPEVSSESESAEGSRHSSASPAPSSSGMTSAALLARNSQAGPHKCSRVNPSTGKPCNTVFSRPYDLTRHEDTIHNNRKIKVRCPYCREEKTFSRNDALTRHMRVVHPEVNDFGKKSRRGD